MKTALYLVGGAVRDHFLNVRTKDFDIAVEAPSFAAMCDYLKNLDVRPWITRPEYVTVRGSIPRVRLVELFQTAWGPVPIEFPEREYVDADFTMCRAETMYSDNRHPDVVTPTHIFHDLARRDFTMNAMAVSEGGELLDPYRGLDDIHNGELEVVGDPAARFTEDPLRMLRAIRFMVRYGMEPSARLTRALDNELLAEGLKTLPEERIQTELQKAFHHDTWTTLLKLAHWFPEVGERCFTGGLWLKPTLEL